MIGNLSEYVEITPWAAVPVYDLASTGPFASQRVSLENYGRVVVLILKNAIAAGQDPTFAFIQANAATSGTTKELPVDAVWTKLAASPATLVTTGEFTKTEISPAAASYTNATLSESAGFLAFEIDASKLDTDNGFKFIGVTCADSGATAQLAAGWFLLYESRYKPGVSPLA